MKTEQERKAEWQTEKDRLLPMVESFDKAVRRISGDRGQVGSDVGLEDETTCKWHKYGADWQATVGGVICRVRFNIDSFDRTPWASPNGILKCTVDVVGTRQQTYRAEKGKSLPTYKMAAKLFEKADEAAVKAQEQQERTDLGRRQNLLAGQMMKEFVLHSTSDFSTTQVCVEPGQEEGKLSLHLNELTPDQVRTILSIRTGN